MRGYPIGIEIQEKHGRVKKKVGEQTWIGRGRFIYIKENGKAKLTADHRVFHKNGDKADDSPDNLVAIKFNGTRYDLAHSRVVWMPKKGVVHDGEGNKSV